MYVVTVTLQIKPGQMAAFLPLMTKNARASLAQEPGCQHFDICREGDTVFLYEIYDDRAAFDIHLASPHFQSFDAEVNDMVQDKRVACYGELIR